MIDFLETMKILIVQLHFFNKIKLKLHFYKINNIFNIKKRILTTQNPLLLEARVTC